MGEPNDQREEIQAEFDRLYAEFDALSDIRCQMRSSCRKIQEAARVARRGGLLESYLRATLQIADKTEDLLEPQLGRETTVEMVALLEDEDRARLIQPDLDEGVYSELVYRMLPCVYDKLAVHTARMQGYNSPGMQACINAGIEVCRRTGKLQCLTCFREYATSVYLSGDDLDMALHSARQVAGIPEDSHVNFRRWSGTRDETQILLLQGRLGAAEESAVRALELAPIYYNADVARRESMLMIDTVRLLSGDTAHAPEAPAERDVDAGEAPALELAWDLHDALAATIRCEYQQAQSLLRAWDQKLTSAHCLDDWFEVRLRLIALQRIVGDAKTQQRLADQLREKARVANDWLTLRRLERLMDPAESASPFPFAESPDSGPFADQPIEDPESAESTGASPTQSESTVPLAGADEVPGTPLASFLSGLGERMAGAREDAVAGQGIAQELLTLTPDQVTAAYDAGWALHLMQFLVDVEIPARDIWNWGESIASRHMNDARVLNTLATLAFRLSEIDDELKALCDDQRIAALFQQSLDLDPTLPRNFARAGAYYFFRDRVDDAERCFSRAFRLDRTNGVVATQLAQLYENGDRDRDALAVLDLSLREGCEDPQVAWNAALLAYSQEQYAALLTYLDRFESQSPGEPWVNYYRAISLLEQDRPDEALAAVKEELQRNPEQRLHVEILEACALAARRNVVEFRSQLRAILRCRPAEASYLTLTGFVSLYQRLWRAAGCLPVADELRRELESRLLQTGLAPDELVETMGQRGDEIEEVDFYRVLANQPVASDWKESNRCLPGQESWTEYNILWGVLARSEDEAARLVLDLQNRCEGIPASLLKCFPAGESYKEIPRIVWQGERSPPALESRFDSDDSQE